MKSRRIEIYSEGSLEPNPAVGNWKMIVSYDGKQESVYGGKENVSKNRIELIGIVYALYYIKTQNLEFDEIDIISYNSYVVKGINDWIYKWMPKQEEVANQDCWNIIWKYIKMYNKRGKRRLKASWFNSNEVEEPSEEYITKMEQRIESMAKKDKNLNRLNKYI